MSILPSIILIVLRGISGFIAGEFINGFIAEVLGLGDSTTFWRIVVHGLSVGAGFGRIVVDGPSIVLNAGLLLFICHRVVRRRARA
jgi:hypothetical protein